MHQKLPLNASPNGEEVVGDFIQRVAIGIACLELKSAGKTVSRTHHKAVVV